MNKIYRLEKNNNFNSKNNDEIISQIINNYDEQKNILLYGPVQSGKTRNLIKLTREFLNSNKVDVIFYIVGNTNELKNQNRDRFKKALKEFTVVETEKQIFGKALLYCVEGKTIFILLKQYIEEMAKCIDEYFKDTNVLVIDDEADDYSLSDKSVQAFNIIKNSNAGIISCTATPFLNLYWNEKFYDIYYKLSASANYLGIHDFDENIKIINFDMKNIRKLLVKIILEWVLKINESNVINDDAQLLFNISTQQDDHDEYYDIVFDICEKIKHGNLNDEELDEFFKDKNEKQIFEIRKVINGVLENGIKIANGKYNDNIQHKIKNSGFEIIIGGIFLSRGITYKNLVSELMVNVTSSSKAHTVVQRSRWCGYRYMNSAKQSYKNEMTIYFDNFANEAYNEIKKLDKITTNYYMNTKLKYKERIDDIISAFNSVKII